MKRIILLASIISICATQVMRATELWRSHLTYSSVTQVAETPSKVFALSDGALFAYNKSTQAVNVYSKIDGLSDSKVSIISYSVDNNMLVIVYDNANIDLLTNDGKVYNVPEIMNKTMSTDKTIYKVNFVGNLAYLSTAYGITIINLQKHEATDSYLLYKKTLATAIFGGKIYAATDQGIMGASLTSNVIDPNNWSITHTLKANDLVVFQNNLLAVVSKTGIYTVTASSSTLTKSNVNFTNLFVANNVLVAFGLNQLSYFTTISLETVVAGTNFSGISALDPTVKSWHAATTSGLNRIDKVGATYTKVALGLKPDGPLANNPYRMKFSGNKLMVVGGGAWDARFGTSGQMMFFENEKWSYLRVDTILAQGLKPRDFLDIVEDPRELNHYFVTSYGEGVFEFRNQKLVKTHDHYNSTIEAHALVGGIPHYDRTAGLCYDKDYNLYVTNMHVSKAIKVLTKDGVWTSMTYPLAVNKECLFEITRTKSGIIWALDVQVGQGIFAFDTKGTLADQSDDQSKFISTVDYYDDNVLKSIVPDFFFCMAEDKNGAMWVGTEKGPVVYNNSSNIFNANFVATRIKIPRNDGSQRSDFLLENDLIKAIAVDASNRKWIGTDANGVYLLNETGVKTLHHFTSENSPMPSNKILSVAIHPTTGEVFIGTDKGLVSYNNDALDSKKNYSEVYAFPNPLRPEYDGLITITGIKAGTTVRITDVAGNDVFTGISESSQITWSGRNSLGERVATGVYLVYASTSDSIEGVVTKIMIIK